MCCAAVRDAPRLTPSRQQITKWDAQLGGPASTTPAACDNARTQTANLLLYNMGLLDNTYISQISITGGFGATKFVNTYMVANPVCP